MINIVSVPNVHPPYSLHDNQRPILLTPYSCKILESFIGQWMLQLVTEKFNRRQYRVLEGRSTIHTLINIFYIWHQALDTCKCIRIQLVDYSKAFDRFDHAMVLSNIASLGIPSFIFK
jgi:hypothetical protein